MKEKVLISMLLLLLIGACAQAQKKPVVYLLATGGTIAGVGNSEIVSGYKSGVISVDQIIESVPELKDLADIHGEQVVNIPSQDITEKEWLVIAKRVNVLLSKDDVDAIVITHGTDTMEETAYFLNLVVKSKKPVVMVGSMRPSTALSADGPMNIYQGVCVAIDSNAIGRGVMIVTDDKICSADDVLKTRTTALETFECPNYGYLGYVYNGKPIFTRNSVKKHTWESEFDISDISRLPNIGIVYGYAGVDSIFVNTLIQKNADGIVYAGVGNGNPNTINLNALAYAVEQGVTVVRSSRTPFGPTTQYDEVDDDKYGFVASWFKTPEKARILLMLALTKTENPAEIQEMFLKY